ncbi:hypothetical protein DPMN_090333 [Dreissena polymorpha]|uniref:Uncharacterized protein n=1 Tax=Dreissena polymorpha TaxID=45954 RepID=A0A9D4QYY9_DREPO|nr:hypothetical protein DPMN_090333 [Dreissena polymorpha]
MRITQGRTNVESTNNCISNFSLSESTTTTRPKAPQLYIMPCICNPNKQWTNLSNEQIIDMLISELTIDASETTAARAKLNCRQDSRASSKAIGTIAVGIMSVIFGLVICSDLITIWRYCGRIRKRFKRVYRPSNKVGVAQDETTIQSSLSL